MNNRYKTFYFLHIPKTGGRYFNKYIRDNLQIYFVNVNPKYNISCLKKQGHYAWQRDIRNSTYIVCFLRDPIKLACSYFSHFVSPYNNNTKEDFMRWLKKSRWFHNFQCKNLLLDSPVVEPLDNNAKIYQIKLTKQDLIEKINRINALFTIDYLRTNPNDVYLKICSDLGMETKKLEFPYDEEYNNTKSYELYNSLSESEIKEISNFFKWDYYIYNKVVN